MRYSVNDMKYNDNDSTTTSVGFMVVMNIENEVSATNRCWVIVDEEEDVDVA
jgi:hypothetical protein